MRCYALAVLLVAASPIASDWWMFGVTRDSIGPTVNFVDLASVTGQGDIRTVRVAQVDGDKRSPAEERLASVDIDCASSKLRLNVLSVTYWSGTTENFAAQHRPWLKPSPWQEVGPGSWGGALQALICKGEGRDKAQPITGSPLQAGRELLKNAR